MCFHILLHICSPAVLFLGPRSKTPQMHMHPSYPWFVAYAREFAFLVEGLCDQPSDSPNSQAENVYLRPQLHNARSSDERYSSHCAPALQCLSGALSRLRVAMGPPVACSPAQRHVAVGCGSAVHISPGLPLSVARYLFEGCPLLGWCPPAPPPSQSSASSLQDVSVCGSVRSSSLPSPRPPLRAACAWLYGCWAAEEPGDAADSKGLLDTLWRMRHNGRTHRRSSVAAIDTKDCFQRIALACLSSVLRHRSLIADSRRAAQLYLCCSIGHLQRQRRLLNTSCASCPLTLRCMLSRSGSLWLLRRYRGWDSSCLCNVEGSAPPWQQAWLRWHAYSCRHDWHNCSARLMCSPVWRLLELARI